MARQGVILFVTAQQHRIIVEFENGPQNIIFSALFLLATFDTKRL